jgi:hypothetical protein
MRRAVLLFSLSATAGDTIPIAASASIHSLETNIFARLSVTLRREPIAIDHL